MVRGGAGYACVMTPASGAHETPAAEPDRVMAAGVGSGPAVTPLAGGARPRSSRSLDERLMIRLPGSYRVSAALIRGLVRPETRLRRRFLRRAVVSGWAAVQRRDFELMLVRYARCRVRR